MGFLRSGGPLRGPFFFRGVQTFVPGISPLENHHFRMLFTRHFAMAWYVYSTPGTTLGGR